MQANIVAINWKAIGQAVVGLGAGVYALAVLTGVKLPFVTSDRVALVGLFVIGFMFCAQGMEIDKYGWLNPLTLAGCVVGALMLVLFIATFAGLRLPFIPTDRAAFLTLTLMGLFKVGLSVARALAYRA
jgi:hypothetical protein